MQLVDGPIAIIRPGKGAELEKIYYRKDVYQKFGVWPEQIRDYLSLTGDQSDNIPGVAGIGEKTALKLFAQFQSLADIYEHLEQITPDSLKQKLIRGRDSAMLAQQLVQLDSQIPMDLSWELMKLSDPDFDTFIPMIQEYGFTKFLNRYQKKTRNFHFTHTIINSEEAFNSLIGLLQSAPWLALDTETTALDPQRADLVGISVAYQAHEGFYLPFVHNQGKNLPANCLVALAQVLRDKPIVGQNIKFDLAILARHGIELNRIAGDTMIAAYLLNPDHTHYNLDHLAQYYLNYQMLSYNDLIKETNARNFSEVPPERAAFYSSEDVVVTWHIWQKQEPLLKEKKLMRLFTEIELPLINVLASMERAGVYIDRALMQHFSHDLQNELAALELKIHASAGCQFNINSPKQLSEILFQRLKLPTIRKTKTGLSTDVGVLEALSSKHELPAMLLEYRQIAKLKSTYTDPLIEIVDPETGLVHPSFNQTVAATGRLSCSNPNLQNVPIRSEKGRVIRQAFQARNPDTLLISADYSQIELRILAHLADDAVLIEAFAKGLDIHTQTAALIYNLEEEAVTKEMRRQAKTINFGVIYGMSGFSLAQSLGISRKEADFFIETYFNRFPGVKQFIDQTIAFAETHGYVTTLFNRIRYVTEIDSKNFNRREMAKRIAVNTPVQGSAADIIKRAMIDLLKWRDREEPGLLMVLQIHDELLFECPRNELERLLPRIKATMENTVRLKVPLVVDIGTGRNWLEAH